MVHRDTAQAVSGAASTIKVMVSGGDAEVSLLYSTVNRHNWL